MRQAERETNAKLKNVERIVGQKRPHDVSFGLFIRTARLGFHSAPFGYMRVSPHPKGFRIELMPLASSSEDFNHSAKGEYYCWWEGDFMAALRTSPVMRGLKEVKKRMDFVLDDNGDLVE